ncbi:helix-turn-helix domain-containing protein [Clostridium saudiense]|jgi:excisionase family DNA binding protein|uniref:helix-turn-helix domain-containing protein n=1 Tax=Clostridium saudiense TaxID=1414720 RepID=UPI0018ABFF4A|nr:helix-turn-helix domain-containing protein [Clostridium saudiense]
MRRSELPEVMTIKDVQEFLKISKNTAYDLIKREEFPVVRLGRLLRINREKFLEWFDKAS